MSREFPIPRTLRPHPLAFALAASLAFAPVQPGLAHPSGGATLTVDNCNDSGAGSLRDAIAAAVSGDHIVIAPSDSCTQIVLTSGPLLVANGADAQPLAALDIQGAGPDAMTIDGGGADRVIVQSAGADALLTLTGLHVTNGRNATQGGCIAADGSLFLKTVDVSDCVAGIITGDRAFGNAPVRGGGIYAAGSVRLYYDTAVRDCKVYGGGAYAYGGGVFALGQISVFYATIANNEAHSAGGAAYGGGLAVGDRAARMQGDVDLYGASIEDNTAESLCSFCGARGGGVWTYGYSVITAGDFSRNFAASPYGYGTGGGLYFASRFDGPPAIASVTLTDFECNHADTAGAVAAGGDLFVSRATLACNVAYADGGAITMLGGDLSLSYSTISGNLAGSRGGGVFIFGYGLATINNSTISGNEAANGGAIANTYGSLSIANSTIYDNGSTDSMHGGGIYFRYAYYPIDVQSSIIAGNFVEDLWPPGMTVTGSHDIIMSAAGVTLPGDTISASPMLGPLTFNGGPTLTHLPADGSPAIDAGSNPLAFTNDQRGDGYVREFGSAPDIGAVEVQPGAPPDRIFANGFEP